MYSQTSSQTAQPKGGDLFSAPDEVETITTSSESVNEAESLSFDMSLPMDYDMPQDGPDDAPPSVVADRDRNLRYPCFDAVPVKDSLAVMIDPRVCSVFRGNPRCNSPFIVEDRKDLVDSMRTHGNMVPVRARRDPNGGQGFEIFSGAQRLGAALHIQASDPGFRLLATLSDGIGDEEAFTLSEADNAGRSEPPPLLQAKCWAFALHNLYGGNQQKLADAAGKDKSVVSRTLALLQLPEYVLRCIDNLDMLNPYFAQQIVPALNDLERKPVIEARANALFAKHTILKPPALVKYLLGAPPETKIQAESDTLWEAHGGGAELKFKDDRQHQAQSYTLKIIRPLDAKSRREMLVQFKAHLDTFSQNDPSQ